MACPGDANAASSLDVTDGIDRRSVRPAVAELPLRAGLAGGANAGKMHDASIRHIRISVWLRDACCFDARAESARDCIMPQVATRADIVEMKNLIEEMKNLIERQGMLLTIRLGGMIVFAFGILATVLLTSS